jgi:hypothetical protein
MVEIYSSDAKINLFKGLRNPSTPSNTTVVIGDELIIEYKLKRGMSLENTGGKDA